MTDGDKILLSRSCIALSKYSWLMYERDKTENMERKQLLGEFINRFQYNVKKAKDSKALDRDDLDLCERLLISSQNLAELFVSLYWSDDIHNLYKQRDPGVYLAYARDHSVSSSMASPNFEYKLSQEDEKKWRDSPWRQKISQFVHRINTNGGRLSRRQGSKSTYVPSFKVFQKPEKSGPVWKGDRKIAKLTPVVQLRRLSADEIFHYTGKRKFISKKL